MKLLLLFVLLAGCDATATVRFVCRGDSTPAKQDTSLVKCSTLDSLSRHPDTTRTGR